MAFLLPLCLALGFVGMTGGKTGKNFYLHKAIIIKLFLLKYPVEGFYEQILILKTSAIILKHLHNNQLYSVLTKSSGPVGICFLKMRPY